MADIADLFPDSLALTPGVAPAWDQIPAKGAVYLLTCHDEDTPDKPLLLATVGDLRSALKRRLDEIPPDAKSKRVPYSKICTRLHWRRVDSSFAANWWYWRAARVLFPDSYKALLAWRTSWWIAVEREGPFPRLKRTSDLSDPALRYAGPIRDKTSAGKLIETLEDLFDLCRYHQELVQAPHGRPCAYKEMGKCPAPCDGSVPIAWYRGQIDKAWTFLTGETRPAWRSDVEQSMKAAAARLEFETAARLKQRLTRAGFLDTDPFTHLRPLQAFSFLSLQPGKGKPWLEPWLIHGGHVECLPQLHKKNAETDLATVLTRFQELTATPIPPALDEPAMEQIALLTHHLFRGDNSLYLPPSHLSADPLPTLLAAAQTLWSRKATPKPLIEQSNEPTPLSDGPAPAGTTPENSPTVPQPADNG